MNDKFLQFLGLVKRSGKLIEGYNKCEEFIKKYTVYLIIISLDASENTKEKFRGYAIKHNIPYIQHYGEEELGNCIGRTAINVLGISDNNMADKLLKLYDSVKNNRG
jgi:ribosomal protein L7Ae-like RNA K-turn-binding protein